MEDLLSLLDLQFFRHALLASLLTSVVAGIIGSYIVARKIVFLSGGITHASFGGIGIAYFLGLNPFFGAAVFAIFSALGIEYISEKESVREDSAIGILWSFGMALGILFVFFTPGYAPNLMTFLFGSILTITPLDVVLLAILTVLIGGVFIFFYRPILFTAYDSKYAHTTGMPVGLLRYSLMALVALAIVFSMRIAGVILVLSLFTIPQAIANLYSNDFKKMIAWSILWCIVGNTGGLIFSYFFDLPSGATIVFCLVILWVVNRLIFSVLKRLGLSYSF